MRQSRITSLPLAEVLLISAYFQWREVGVAALVTMPYPKNAERLVTATTKTDTKTVGNGGFFRWPEAVVEANGDFRNEKFLEKIIGGPLYSRQDELPNLPVPPLDETIGRFIPTALPLADTEEEKQEMLEACRKFPNEAQELQARLLKRQHDFKDSSWLAQLWSTLVYLQARDPIAVFVSYFLHIPDDSTLPSPTTENEDKRSSFTKNNWPGIQRAAAILVAVAESRKRICSGNMACETMDSGNEQPDPLCSSGFKYMFHSCRIPRKDQDIYRLYDPSLHKHCVVACQGYFFALEFVDDEGNALPLSVLEARLKRCIDLAQQEEERGVPKIGWLTSSPRQFWARSRQDLIDMGGGGMEEALSKLESAAFVLNLDHEEAKTPTEADNFFWHGSDSCGSNRWFDKPIQLICTRNGKVAYQGEHSMLDAAPAISICTRIMKTKYKNLKAREMKESLSTEIPVGSGVKNIFQDCWSSLSVSAKASNLTKQAKNHHKDLTNDYEIRSVIFEGYGKKFIKQSGIKPDSYLQMAMQVASYRLFKKQVATYESAQTRAFLHGRTETTRSISPASAAFVKSMGFQPKQNQDTSSRLKKLYLLRQATEVHSKYHSNAEKGLGVDRHFLGLASMLQHGEKEPSLFSNPLYQRSKRWQLSTSTVSYSPGFGPAVGDGIGIGYGANGDSCIFSCTSRRENEFLDHFCHLLQEALVEMGELVVASDTVLTNY